MDWREAAAAFPPLEEKDIAQLQLSKEESEQVLILFNRAILNAQSDSADIAMIALKKLLTQFPDWAEAALLFGICLALDDKMKRALASFEHAISSGLMTEQLAYLAQTCYREAGDAHARQYARKEAAEHNKVLASALLPSKKSRSIFREIDTEERGHMQAPILTRAPRSAGKARLASDKERRDVLMQSNSGNADSQDEEIDVSIPKTPAEKLRITVIAVSSVAAAVLLGLAVWFLIIPGIQSMQESSQAAPKLEYLLSALAANKDDPEVSEVLSEYNAAYPAAGTTAPAAVTTVPQAAETAVQTTLPTETTVPGQTDSQASQASSDTTAPQDSSVASASDTSAADTQAAA